MRKPDEKNLRELYEQLGSPSADWLKALENAMSENMAHFIMRYVLAVKDDHKLRFDIDFFKLDGESTYSLERYKAALFGTIPIPDLMIGGVNTKELEAKMAKISWDQFDKEGALSGPTDERMRGLDKQVRDIQKDLHVLRKTTEGLKLVRQLETKFFSNMPFVSRSPIQKQYDRIEEQHGVAHLFKISDGNGPSFYQAYEMLNGERPLPTTPYQSNICQVNIANLETFLIDNYTGTSLINNESYYFRTMDKAFAYAHSLDNRYFFPDLVMENELERAITKLAIAHEFTQDIYAVKHLLEKPLQSPHQGVLGWEVNVDKISIAEFERQTSFPLHGLDKFDNSDNKFIVATGSAVKATARAPRKKKASIAKKNNGNQQN